MHFGGKGYSRVWSRPLFQNLILEYCNEVELRTDFLYGLEAWPLEAAGVWQIWGRKKYSGSHFFSTSKKNMLVAYISVITQQTVTSCAKFSSKYVLYSTFSKSMSSLILDRTSFASRNKIWEKNLQSKIKTKCEIFFVKPFHVFFKHKTLFPPQTLSLEKGK